MRCPFQAIFGTLLGDDDFSELYDSNADKHRTRSKLDIRNNNPRTFENALLRTFFTTFDRVELGPYSVSWLLGVCD